MSVRSSLHSEVPVEAKLIDLKEDDGEDIYLLLKRRGTRDNEEDRGGIAGYLDRLPDSAISVMGTRGIVSEEDIEVL
ncbi:hypothetical protein NEOLI_002949 [Neolecta irregularis DAH-3]|uniref:Uncharacterized protein n=1 Tax=Neolecta irregularis (strain DAH-3) TaxID=1198029 RepID=A0A1U7LQ52_NEOID|nr:hypothetical protein NEOLI_002949 [Neolecta irregularis DAH-3]|eukprot:OLL24713.1 hypothetical protein NEOLI_002949 [Neolecta irregularis DAH-3]